MKFYPFIIILLFFISCSEEKKEIKTPKEFEQLKAEINIGDSAFRLLQAYRDTAISNGVIAKKQKKYVLGTLTINGNTVPIKLRLKGDWVDHLKGDKWSFRIKVRGENAFMGLKSFSIQSPHTRAFLHEWFMHKMYEQEGVLTTRYEFIPIVINGKEMGVYALEEHFDKQLVESKNRREGPILKFNEEGVWETRIGDPSAYHSLPYFAAAEVMPFKKNRTLKNPVLKEHFKTAQNLLLQHKSFSNDIDEIFDLDKMAKFYALTDIANTDHPLIWHNLRFYYNPVSRKLEPVAYDCYPEDVKMSVNQPIFGYAKEQTDQPDFMFIHYNLFNNETFKNLYISYLKKYTDSDFLNAFFKKIDAELTTYEKLLASEYPESSFDKEFYSENAKAIQAILPDYINFDKKYTLKTYPFEDLSGSNTYYYNTGLKAYSNPFQDTINNVVQLYNYHSTPVTIIGYGLKQNKDSLILLDTYLTIPKWSNKNKTYRLTLPRKVKKLFILTKNKPLDTLRISIEKWSFSVNQVEPVSKIQPLNFKRASIVQVNSSNKLLIIKEGNYTVENDIILPKGWTFIIQKGVEIDLINNATIISYSPIYAEGTSKEPIKIYSSDSTGQGLVIIDNYGNSSIKNVTFSHLSTLKKYGWHLTGAVTFYQSNVTVDSCVFINNHCEDAINLVQSNFTFENSFVQNTFSDGFDADFCTGTLFNSAFINTGNDCIDLSGSTIKIDNCKIDNAGDKGISGGENSQITISNVQISNAKIAIASKDFSTVTVNSSIIKNVEFDYVVFRKKPEYGPATIIVNSNNKDKYNALIDRFATFVFNGDTTMGTDSVDVNALYADF